MNIEIRKLENILVATLNNSQAPIEAKRILLENLLMKVKEASDSVIRQELHIQEENDEEDIRKDTLGELPSEENSDQCYESEQD